MKKFLVFVFLILFVTVQCKDDGGYQESLDNMSKMGILGIIQYSLQPPPKFCRIGKDMQIEDNFDGTISLVRTDNGINFSGTCANYYLYKKCLQGQVYRKAENDCKGKGNESDYYGAQLMTMQSSGNERLSCSHTTDFDYTSWQTASFTFRDTLSFEIYIYNELLIDILIKEHPYLENQCLWMGTYNDDTVKCNFLPENEIIKVNIDKYRVYILCYSRGKTEHRDDKGNLL